MEKEVWHMNRMGIVDFWYYADEEFHFSDGHMLLRGSNGSGKSVTMQSLIPLLLDGNRSSERLDPFGSRARKLDTYLIDEDSSHEERIGYLYLEFKKGNNELYTTVGMGARARKNRPLDVWYFVIEDNRRIKIDLFLTEGKKTLTKQELKNRIGNQLIENQRQYMEKVNQVLFGFEHVTDYKEAIDLLLQLRAPKLSNSFKPTMLNDVLSQSLQPLNDEDLRDMSESISNMDSLKAQLESLKISTAAASDLMNTYQKYNEAVLYEKLNQYQTTEEQRRQLEISIANVVKKKKEMESSNESIYQEVDVLQAELGVLTEEKNMLGHSDLVSMQHDVSRIEAEIADEKKRLVSKNQTHLIRENRLMDQQHILRTHTGDLEQCRKQLDEFMENLDDIRESWSFVEHDGMKTDVYDKLWQSYHFEHGQKQIEAAYKIVTAGISKFTELAFYEKQYTVKENLHAQIEDDLADKEGSLKNAIQLYQDVIEEYKENISQYSNRNAFINFDDKQMQQMIAFLLGYETTQDYQGIVNMVTTLKDALKDQLRLKLIKEKSKHEQLLAERENASFELKKWQEQKDAAPMSCELSVANRQYLEELMVPYVPLYKILEFKEGTDEDFVNGIEEVLVRTGMLDALLVEEKYRSLLMKKNPEKTDNYIFVKAVVKELKQIELNEKFGIVEGLKMLGATSYGQLEISAEGFKLGLLEGNLSAVQPAKFVGRTARENYRQKMIDTWKETMNQLTLTLEETVNKTLRIEADLEQIDEESRNFPTDEHLKTALLMVRNLETEIEDKNRHLGEVLSQLGDLKRDMLPIREKIHEHAAFLNIGINQWHFLETEELINDYRVMLQQFAKTHQDYVRIFELKETVASSVENIMNELDEIRYEISEFEGKITHDESVLALKRKHLEASGFADIRQRLAEIDERLQFIPEKIGVLKQQLGSHLTQLSHLEEQLEKEEVLLVAVVTKTKGYFEILKQEVDLGLVVTDKNWDVSTLKSLFKQRPLLEQKEKTYGDLYNKFHTRLGALQEYSVSMNNMQADTFEGIDEVSSRVLIMAKVSGKRVNLIELLDQLAKDKETAQHVLNDEDRKLFEEILISTVSKKIRARIRNSDDWVKKMNGYMAAMDTSKSSGLKLQLVWKPHSATNDEQLDTKALVSLLMRDEHLLTEGDKNRVSRHFKSKIDLARDTNANELVTESFHQIMRDVMDYRQWFTFTINYEKAGESKKELTNNKFATFSGGEKAMAMYIPLFSSVAAKFDNAKKDSPVIIALDEAFAGVDEGNIDAMFGLIGKFNFDYIMTSQALWGDYPEVRNLSIYELHRPNNATFVTLMRYHWNGHVKEYIRQ